ncbi:hypothetical protein [Absidia glauca]|uniref:Transcription factor STE12 n=1 Tax=Absidia glauca TaxID=4829 RepID=A0A163JGY9_ABSGL|nr:hypothetical protein [Absidia glauca]
MVLKNPSYSPIITVENNDSAPTKPTNNNESERLAWIDELKLFLATAASSWDEAHDNNNDYDAAHPLKKFHLHTGETISCVLWEGFYLITGTDIVRSLYARFHAFGRPVTNTKKFEEGVFSDLRNLKPGLDARLEDPKSDLLEMLYKNDCIRTQKKQKVFFWYSVPHDRLFLDALERDLKREKLALAPSTMAMAEPAMSTCLNTAQTLLDQLKKATTLFALALEDEPTATDSVSALDTIRSSPNSPSLTLDDHELHKATTTPVRPTSNAPPILAKSEARTRRSRVRSAPVDFEQHHHDRINRISSTGPPTFSPTRHHHCQSHSNKHQKLQPYQLKKSGCSISPSSPLLNLDNATKTRTIFGSLTLFDGSPTYKQRRRRAVSTSSTTNHTQHVATAETESIRTRRHVNCHLHTNPSPPKQQRYTTGLKNSTHSNNLHRPDLQSTSHASHQLDRPTQQFREATPQFTVATQQPPPNLPDTSELAMNPAWLAMMEDTSFVALKDVAPSLGSTHMAPDASGLYDMDPPASSSMTSSLYAPDNMDMEINDGSVDGSCYLYKPPVFASPDLNRLPYSASPGTLFWSDEEGHLSPSSLSSSLTSPSSILHYQNYHSPLSHPSQYNGDSSLLLPLAPAIPYQCLALPTNHSLYYAPILPPQTPTPNYNTHIYNIHPAYDAYPAVDDPLIH